ncbi:BolA family transcriptional regulator [Pacificitalea manganoxidans]|uniref:BolA family transcriptional regulator n=1 Tax=Pacificitalea manganoxidans TaxID=1411902 RepID=A0A291LYM2_9RHOB|nr:BolA family protein [Pacificitalea manganoxidans]MAQ47226.1 BolA family transcriptional regulator [Actibacterium sp.]OWU67574.1 BolA family transcriptional regulator [Roseovarius sp. 22II1-1F6A]ATI41727.1 BolA family transcriptional regulator [Pacificitalea manganoxidans]MBF53527.1 BolA family transcriptional regulator [Actibacterium sp.]MDR6309186.1 BolA protein [Pacificitalea manganoxidans]|tara:strand:+ start:503 stop:763 length:261 start_codon:yes stop_codon:yes gene_type:complete
MSVTEEIRQALEKNFSPTRLEVIDESEKHRGHAGYQDGGESHFRVRIASEVFAPMSRISRHRAVHSALGPAIIDRIHALALEIETG